MLQKYPLNGINVTLMAISATYSVFTLKKRSKMAKNVYF